MNEPIPRIVIVVEDGVVKQVRADATVEFVVLDRDLLTDEDVVNLARLAKTLPAYAGADRLDKLSLDDQRRHFKEDAQRRLRLLTE